MTNEPTLTEEKKLDIGWAIVELMGHRRMAGYLTETELAGSAFFRIDVPETADGRAAATQYFRGEAVYAITPCTEDLAARVSYSDRPAPVNRWSLAVIEAPKVERGASAECAQCGSMNVTMEGAAEGWVCQSCGATDEDE